MWAIQTILGDRPREHNTTVTQEHNTMVAREDNAMLIISAYASPIRRDILRDNPLRRMASA